MVIGQGVEGILRLETKIMTVTIEDIVGYAKKCFSTARGSHV